MKKIEAERKKVSRAILRRGKTAKNSFLYCSIMFVLSYKYKDKVFLPHLNLNEYWKEKIKRGETGRDRA